MKIRIRSLFTVLFAFLLISAFGQTSFTMQSLDMKVNGTSNLHDWTSEVTNTKASAEMNMEDGNLKSIESLSLSIQVENIKSEKGKMMDKKTYKALESKDHPIIKYQLSQVTSVDANAVGTQGKLTIAGNTRTINMKVSYDVLPDGRIQFTGTKGLKMTDFGIDPPKALLGALTTGDEVTIDFTATFKAASDYSRK